MSMTPPPFNGTPSPAATPPAGVPQPFHKAATPPPFNGDMGVAARSTTPAVMPASQPQPSAAPPAGEAVLPAAAVSAATPPANIPESKEASRPGIEISAAESSAPAASPLPIEAAAEAPAGDNDSPRKRLIGIGAVCLVVAIGAGISHVSSTKTAAEAPTVPPAAAAPPPATAAATEPPPVATPAKPVPAAEAESAKATASDKSAKPVKPEAPAWLRSLRAELDACDKKSFPASGLCSEKARWKYCAPKHWDKVRECAVERRDL